MTRAEILRAVRMGVREHNMAHRWTRGPFAHMMGVARERVNGAIFSVARIVLAGRELRIRIDGRKTKSIINQVRAGLEKR